MSTPAPAQQEPVREPARLVRDYKTKDRQQSRKRGARRGLAARYALRNLPPLEDDLP